MKRSELDFMNFIDEKYSHFLVSDESQEPVEVISTGSIALDVSTGIGGIPRGRFSVIWGPESSGKTTLSLSVTKQAYKQGLKTLYIDSENGLDYKYVEALVGTVDQEHLTIIQPETAEDALDIAEKGIKSGEFGLIIIDSIGAFAPKKVKEEDDPFKAQVALVSRLMSNFLSRVTYQVRQNNVAFVFVNQIRAKIGGYVSGYEMPGGHALKHDVSLIIYLSRSETIKEGTEPVGIITKFTIQKNKLSPPLKSEFLPIMFGKGIDYHRDLVSFAELVGALSKRGAYYYFEDENLGQGMVKTIEYLKEHQETLDKISKECYNRVNGKENTDEQVD